MHGCIERSICTWRIHAVERGQVHGIEYRKVLFAHLRGPAGEIPAADGTALTEGLAGAAEEPDALISPVLD